LRNGSCRSSGKDCHPPRLRAARRPRNAAGRTPRGGQRPATAARHAAPGGASPQGAPQCRREPRHPRLRPALAATTGDEAKELARRGPAASRRDEPRTALPERREPPARAAREREHRERSERRGARATVTGGRRRRELARAPAERKRYSRKSPACGDHAATAVAGRCPPEPAPTQNRRRRRRDDGARPSKIAAAG
jgi:hypothetical protein